jgi:hypothetical protein
VAAALNDAKTAYPRGQAVFAQVRERIRQQQASLKG